MNDVQSALRSFVLSAFLPGEPAESLRDDTPLVTSGIVDSLAAMQLISFIEDRFGVELDVYDTTSDKFNCIRDIAALIAEKRAPGLERAS